MTTSGTYNYSVNRDQIIRFAMLNIEKLEQTENPTAQEITDMSGWLNMMVKQWMGKADFAPGLKTWTRRHGHLFLSGLTGQYYLDGTTPGWSNSYVQTATTATKAAASTVIPVGSSAGMVAGDNIGIELDANYIYWTTIAVGGISGNNVTINGSLPSQSSIGSAVYDYPSQTTSIPAQQPELIETVFLRDQYYQDTPMTIIRDVKEYDALPNKADPTNQSDPVSIYYEWQLGKGVIYTDCGAASDLTKHICMTYMEEIQDFNNPLNTPEYPQQWFLPLALGLSKIAAPSFHAEWTPLMESNYVEALAIARRKEPEISSMYFQPGVD